VRRQRTGPRRPVGSRGAGRRGAAWRALALLAAVGLLAACDRGDEPPVATPGDAEQATDEGGGGPPGEDAEAATPPDVVFLTVDEVVTDVEADTLDASVANVAAGLPEGWVVAVVPDPALGPFVVGLPEGATVWRVGEDLVSLRAGTDDAAWLRYWEPVLAEASEAGDGSSLRSVVAIPGGDAADDLHLTLNATPPQDLPVDDPAALADAFAASFRDQGLEVEEATTTRAGDDEVGAVTVTTPTDEFDDGVPRRLHQWFYPEVASPVLWSVTCGGPAPTPTVDEVCPTVLAAFRTPVR
jgi:hypothetical protein